MRINSVDIVYGAQAGDEGKGKVSAYLASQKNSAYERYSLPFMPNFNEKLNNNYYDFVARWGGGANAGHTVYLNSVKYKTHIVPSGIFYGIKSFIGPGCVINLDSLLSEISYLKESKFDTSLILISPKAHIVTEKHIDTDKNTLAQKLGTTSRGIAPAYADKYARSGIRFEQIAEKDEFWASFLYDDGLYGNILCEGAQGFYLDVNWGNYPYVTSSETLPYAACSLGFSPRLINNIYAVAKIYETRSGEDPKYPDSLFDNPELARIGDIGKEYGVTTGRRRKVDYLNLDRLIFALKTSGGNKLIISKCDVLDEAKVYKLYYKDKLVKFESLSIMKAFITKVLSEECNELERIYFSSSTEIVEGLYI